MASLFIPECKEVKDVQGVWLVGGAVRDYLLCIPHKDLDYVVEADSYIAMKNWLKTLGTLLTEKEQYGTIRVKITTLPDTLVADFVLCRKDGPYSDKRRPDHTERGTLLDDLSRRDFTVNAMAMNREGEIYDPFNGRDDLCSKILRTVNSNACQCFSDDPLRMLRAMRFSIIKKFKLSDSIMALLSDKELCHLLKEHVHKDRKREELNKCFKHDTLATLMFFTKFPLLAEACFEKREELWLEATSKKITKSQSI